MLLAKSPGAVLVTLEPAHQILTEADEGADAGAGPGPDSQAGTPCWSSDGSWLWGSLPEWGPSALQTAGSIKLFLKPFTVKGQYWHAAAALLGNFSVKLDCAQHLDAELPWVRGWLTVSI